MPELPKKPAKENRGLVQKAFIDEGFIRPLTDDTLTIKELKANSTGNLGCVVITNIPFASEPRPISWEINLELEKPVLGKIEKTRTVEKALILLNGSSLYVILIELKSSIAPYGESGFNAIADKISHSISRLRILWTSFLFDGSDAHRNIDIEFLAVVIYNDEDIGENPPDDKIMQHPLFRSFVTGRRGNIANQKVTFEGVVATDRIRVFCTKNVGQDKSQFSLSLEEILDEWEIDLFEGSDTTCP